MQRASEVSTSYHGNLLKLMEDLDKSGTILARIVALKKPEWAGKFRINLLEAGQWVTMHPIGHLSQHFGGHFLSLAVCYGINDYVQAKANKGCLVQKAIRPPGPMSFSIIFELMCLGSLDEVC